MSSKTVLITGASGGLGRVVTRAFLDAGYRAAGVSRDFDSSEFEHPEFEALRAELHQPAEIDAAVQSLRARWGRIDALVHLAGGFAGGEPLTRTSPHVFTEMFETNLMSFVHVARVVLPAMQSQRSGRLLAIGSRAIEEPQAGLSAYAASKAAMVSVVETLARENRGLGITANVILPGTMDTPGNRHAMPDADVTKWVQPEQVAAMLLHLVSDQASQVTGAVIPIYGGAI